MKACKGLEKTSAVQLDLGFKQGREKMCQYDEIYTRAREGTPVFFQFCDGLDMNHMRELFQKGLVSFCTKEKGYTYGKSGKIYQNLCTPMQEKNFLPGYYQGRREYLTSFIGELNSKLTDIKTLENAYAMTESHIQSEYSTLPSNATDCHSISVYNESTKQSENQTVCTEAFYIQSRRQSLWRDLDDIRYKLATVRNDWKRVQASITQANMDLSSIPVATP